MTKRALAADYLKARGEAWAAGRYADGHPMDPLITDFREDDELRDTMLWFAFMAGCDWERMYRGARYADDKTMGTPYVDLTA